MVRKIILGFLCILFLAVPVHAQQELDGNADGKIDDNLIPAAITRDTELPTASTLHLDDVLTALGIASEAVHFGAFSGTTITDNQTAKAAMQLLETAVEGKQAADADLTTWAGITPSANLQTFLGTPNAANFEAAISAGAFASDLLGYANAAAVLSGIGAEPALGNPGTTGWVLSSTDAGVRSWVAASGFSVTDITGQTDDSTPAVTATVALAQGGSLIESTVQQIVDAALAAPAAIGSGTPAAGTFTGVTIAKQSGVAGRTVLYEANSTDTHTAGFRGPASITGDGAYEGIFPNAGPASAGFLGWAAQGGGDGTAATPYLHAMSFYLLDTDLSTVSESDDTLPSAKATKSALDAKAATGHTVQYAATPTIADPDTWTMSGDNMYGGTWIGNAAGTGALPAIAAGMNFTAKARGAYAVTLDPNGTELIWLNGTSCTAGVTIVSDGTTGATAVCQYSAAGEWECDAVKFACGS